MKSIRKKNLIIGTSVILLIGVGLYSLRFLDSRTEKTFKECIFDAPVKCGPTDDRILLDLLNDLKISKKEAKERFQKSMDIDKKMLQEWEHLSETRELTREELKSKEYNEASIRYYQHALQVIEKMED